MTLSTLVLLLVTVQRLGELVLARRNTQRLLKMGAYEVNRGHYPFIVILHTAWIAALWVYGFNASIDIHWLVVFFLFQFMRIWVIATLGLRWTTRIIILPGTQAVTSGPFRLLRHPNYAIVVAEIAVLPIALGLPYLAAIFSLLNAIILTIRIKAENRAFALAV
jgi:isoprenylcysteine carboxyl methyltransferase (ICMT) family protein YpbQ